MSVIPTISLLTIGLLSYALINLFSFGQFFWDKRQARQGGSRIPEKTLLFWALIGGSLGAKLGQRYFRHKTRKHPFARDLNMIILLQFVFVTLLLIPATRQIVLDFLHAAVASA